MKPTIIKVDANEFIVYFREGFALRLTDDGRGGDQWYFFNPITGELIKNKAVGG